MSVAILCGCRTVPLGGEPWAWQVGLELPEFRRSLGVPFDDARSEWSWRMRFTWEEPLPLKADLRLADLRTLLATGSDSLLSFELPQSPTDVAIHIVPMETVLPEAEQVILVVSYGD